MISKNSQTCLGNFILSEQNDSSLVLPANKCIVIQACTSAQMTRVKRSLI